MGAKLSVYTVVRQIFSFKKEKVFFFYTIFSKLKKHINNFFLFFIYLFFFYEKTQFSVWYVLISYESQSFKIITKMSLKIFIISFLQYFNKFTKNLVAYLLDTSIFNRDIHDSDPPTIDV